MAKKLFPQQIKGVDGTYGIRIADISDLTKFEIQTFPEHFQTVSETLKNQIGIGLPTSPADIVQNKTSSALWMAPCKALIVLSKPLAITLSSSEALLVNQTSGRGGFRIYGKKAGYVMRKGVSVDLRDAPQVFQTNLHGMGLLVGNQNNEIFDIFLYRSFMESFESWLLQAALETGYLRE